MQKTRFWRNYEKVIQSEFAWARELVDGSKFVMDQHEIAKSKVFPKIYKNH